jgi:hypothetical protein
MMGTVFAAPSDEINEMENHICRPARTTLLCSTSDGKRTRLRKRETHHGTASPAERDCRHNQAGVL